MVAVRQLLLAGGERTTDELTRSLGLPRKGFFLSLRSLLRIVNYLFVGSDPHPQPTIHFAIMAQAVPNLTFRSYRPEDEEACQLLEERADQFKNPKLRETLLVGGLLKRLQDSIQVYLSYGPRGFDARARVAEDCEVVVGEVENNVVAVVLVNIQTVYWDGTLIKVGWVYGLRVDQEYQRRGIGRRLSEEVERRCLEKGLSMLYLTVNVENERARALYKSLGYQPASHRQQSAVFLTVREHVPSDTVVVPISHETAALCTSQYCDKTDLSLPTREAFANLLSSTDCEGTLLAVRKSDLPDNAQHLDEAELTLAVEAAISSGAISSYGGVSLWNTSATKGLRVVRLIVKKETWLSLPFQATLLAAVVTPLTMWGSNLAGRVTASNSMNTGYWRAGLLLTETIGYCVLSRYAYKVASFVRFIVTRDSRRLQAKAFGAFKHGPRGVQCMESSLVASRVYARSRGYGMWVLNADEHHPDRKVFPKSGFRTIWMQRWLKPMAGISTDKWPAFSPTAFCDPRNL